MSTTEIDTATAPDLMIWSGRCEGCGALAFFGADAETETSRAAEIATTWPGNYDDGGMSWDCAACDGRIQWNGNDPIGSLIPSLA